MSRMPYPSCAEVEAELHVTLKAYHDYVALARFADAVAMLDATQRIAGELAATIRRSFPQCFSQPEEDNAKANARLIAEAPALYEALRGCLTTIENAWIGEGWDISDSSGQAPLDELEVVRRARAVLSRVDGGPQK